MDAATVVKQVRQELGLTQPALALRLGVNAMTVSRYERGVSAVPRHVLLAVKQVRGEKRDEGAAAEKESVENRRERLRRSGFKEYLGSALEKFGAEQQSPKPARRYRPRAHMASALQYYGQTNKKTGKGWTKEELSKKVRNALVRLLAVHGLMLNKRGERIIPEEIEEALMDLIPDR